MVLGAVLVPGIGNLLRLQEARFLAAVDSMSDALILMDVANIVIHVNPSACVLLNEWNRAIALQTGREKRRVPRLPAVSLINPEEGERPVRESSRCDARGGTDC